MEVVARRRRHGVDAKHRIYMTKEVPIQLPRKVADSAPAADHPQNMWRRQRLAAVIDNAPSTGHGPRRAGYDLNAHLGMAALEELIYILQSFLM
jgi:hypothetical protein